MIERKSKSFMRFFCYPLVRIERMCQHVHIVDLLEFRLVYGNRLFKSLSLYEQTEKLQIKTNQASTDIENEQTK